VRQPTEPSLFNLIALKLAPLASLAAQTRYILHATADEYYLPEEILEDAVYAVRLSDSAPDLCGRARNGLAELGRLLRDSAPDLTSPVFVISDPAWCSLRAAAQRCLAAMGFDLASWEASEL